MKTFIQTIFGFALGVAFLLAVLGHDQWNGALASPVATPLSGATKVVDTCNQFVAVNISASGQTQIIGAVSNQSVHICSFHLIANGTTNVSLQEGTGTNCAVGTVTMDGPDALVVGAVDNSPDDISAFSTGPNQAVCVNSTFATQVGGYVTFSQS